MDVRRTGRSSGPYGSPPRAPRSLPRLHRRARCPSEPVIRPGRMGRPPDRISPRAPQSSVGSGHHGACARSDRARPDPQHGTRRERCGARSGLDHDAGRSTQAGRWGGGSGRHARARVATLCSALDLRYVGWPQCGPDSRVCLGGERPRLCGTLGAHRGGPVVRLFVPRPRRWARARASSGLRGVSTSGSGAVLRGGAGRVDRAGWSDTHLARSHDAGSPARLKEGRVRSLDTTLPLDRWCGHRWRAGYKGR